MRSGARSREVYRAEFQSAWDGTCVAWGRNKTAAKAALIEQEGLEGDEGAIRSIVISEYKIEAGSERLCRWLNANFTRDNG